jgi:hypothetical protein
MRGKACSAEFMRRLDKLARQAGWTPACEQKRGQLKPVVQALSHEFCLGPRAIYEMLAARSLQIQALSSSADIRTNEVPHPSILARASLAGKEEAPAVARQAVEEGWTAKEVDREVRRRKQRRAAKNAKQLPDGRFQLLYADPPWEYDFAQSDSRSIEAHYSPLSTIELCDFVVEGRNIQDVPHQDAVLFLWATNPKLSEALQVMRAWGFQYKTNMVWIKPSIGMGYYARQQHELLLIGGRGAAVGQVHSIDC